GRDARPCRGDLTETGGSCRVMTKRVDAFWTPGVSANGRICRNLREGEMAKSGQNTETASIRADRRGQLVQVRISPPPLTNRATIPVVAPGARVAPGRFRERFRV